MRRGEAARFRRRVRAAQEGEREQESLKVSWFYGVRSSDGVEGGSDGVTVDYMWHMETTLGGGEAVEISTAPAGQPNSSAGAGAI